MKKSINFIDLHAQQVRLNNIINDNINNVLSHGKYIMGPEVLELESAIGDYTNCEYVASCGSGTDALVLALMSYNIGPGDIVLCPAFTFPATAEAIAILGAIPYFVDVDEDTFNLSVESLQKAITETKKEKEYKLKAVISVDLYGLPTNYNELLEITGNNNLKLIADAAQSFGASYFNKKVGSLADVTCVSFFPAKPLGCYGDGGAVITNDKYVSEKVKSLRLHGKGKNKYDIDFIGINSRLDTIQAAVLLAKLEQFEWEVDKRNIIANIYTEKLKNYIRTPYVPEGSKSIWAQYTLQHKSREKIQEALKNRGIPTMVYYPLPMNLQKAYRKFNRGSLKVSERLSKEVFSIPMYPDMCSEDQEYIIENIQKII